MIYFLSQDICNIMSRLLKENFDIDVHLIYYNKGICFDETSLSVQDVMRIQNFIYWFVANFLMEC